MKYRFFILGLAAVLFAACAVNEVDKANPALADGGEDVTFYASIEGADTRVYADDQLRVLWNADDRVSIFNRTTYNRQYRFDGQDGDNSGAFKKVPTDDFVTSNPLEYVYSVYPYKEETKISNDGELTVCLPAEQTYREDSFGLGANTMIAVADDNELMFKNLCGYLMLRLYGDNVAVTSISLKGNNNEPLAGKASVVAAIGADPTLSPDASATGEITLTCPTPVTIGTTAATATAFWLVVPPTTFSNGIKITVETSDGRRFEKRTTGRLVISRNTRSKMAALEVIPGYMTPSHYLTFTSDGTTTLSLTIHNGHAPVLYYSTNGIYWTLWDYSELAFTSEQPLYLCGDNPEGFGSNLDATLRYSTISTSGSGFQISGDIMSLIDKDEEVSVIPSPYCFYQLFKGCTGLTSAPELPATILTERCYQGMFYGCTSLATAPELPATTLAECCYLAMFQRCIGLTTAPELPATTLAESCYYSMFNRCTSLTTAPVLPATTLVDGCYRQMFNGCTSLTNALELPATSLCSYCYQYMFNNCSQLNYVKCLATDISAEGCVEGWLGGVSATGTFVKAAGMNDWPQGGSGIPEGWTVEYPLFKAEWRFSAEDCLGAMDGTSYGYRFSAGIPTYKDGVFNGFEKAYSKAEGDGGMFVDSNVSPGGRISYVQIDKTEIDSNNDASRTVGSTGHPYVTGSWIGDYWLFSLSDPDNTVYPAGTKVHIKYRARVSIRGFLYWMLEYWNGEAWVPARPVQDITVDTDRGTQSFQYNLLFESDTNQVIECTYELAAPCAVQQFRQRCMSNIYTMTNSTWIRPEPNTSRIVGNESGQPLFEILATE